MTSEPVICLTEAQRWDNVRYNERYAPKTLAYFVIIRATILSYLLQQRGGSARETGFLRFELTCLPNTASTTQTTASRTMSAPSPDANSSLCQSIVAIGAVDNMLNISHSLL